MIIKSSIIILLIIMTAWSKKRRKHDMYTWTSISSDRTPVEKAKVYNTPRMITFSFRYLVVAILCWYSIAGNRTDDAVTKRIYTLRTKMFPTIQIVQIWPWTQLRKRGYVHLCPSWATPSVRRCEKEINVGSCVLGGETKWQSPNWSPPEIFMWL